VSDRRLDAFPRPLAWLLGAVAVLGIAWALLSPPWQSPDENSHFAYAQTLAERFDLPGDAARPPYSTEQLLAISRSNADQTAASVVTKPEWSREAFESWQDVSDRLPRRLRKDGGGPISSSTNPPAYYLYQALPYRAAYAGDTFDRFYLMRLWSVLLLLVTVTGAWLLGGELFGRRSLLQFVTAAFVGLQPMLMFISSSVNPDALLFAVWSLAMWLGVRVLKHGLTARDGIALFAVVGIAVVTKATGYALLPAALFVLAVGFVRRYRQEDARRRVAMVAIAALLAFALPAGGWLVTARALDRPAVNQISTAAGHEAPRLTSFSPRELASYMWQFYLPKLPSQQRFGGMPDLPVYDLWLKGGWATFGWLEIKLPKAVYALLALLTAMLIAGAVVYVVRRRKSIDLAIAGFLAIAVLVLLAGLHWTEFRTLVSGTGPFNQGRYLLPLAPLFGLAAAATVGLLPERRRPLGAAALLGGMIALQLLSLSLVAGRFYA
jgi:4-amino-4-deoxy-L-arabinose transferase-like glycosyltransferase